LVDIFNSLLHGSKNCSVHVVYMSAVVHSYVTVLVNVAWHGVAYSAYWYYCYLLAAVCFFLQYC